MFARRMDAPPRPAALVVPLGPYSAPFPELVWALFRQRSLAVSEAWVIVDRRGLTYLRKEVLDSGGALDQLRTVLDGQVLGHDDVHLRLVRDDVGEPIEDDRSRRYRETLWNACRDAIARAGDDPVVFGLTEGTQRTTCALLTSCFQLLAREQDLLVDVRVDDPRVDGDVPFYFPEQEETRVFKGHSSIDVRRVGISLVELDVPRMAGFFDGDATSLESVRRESRARVASKIEPTISIDLVSPSVSVDGAVVDLSVAECFWYAYLAWRRGETTDGWVLAGQSGHDDFREFLERAGAPRHVSSIRTKPLRRLIEGEFVHDEDLRNLRGKTVQRLKRWCASNRPEAKMSVVPESDGNGHQRVPVSAHKIQITGLR